jgi:murein DD-endopeptidase MepM/ murein hydrolase activator NlpD
MRRRVAFLGIVLMTAAAPWTAGRAAEDVEISLRARSLQPGELVVLTAVMLQPAQTVRVRAFGRDIPAFPLDSQRWQALIGIDLEVRPGRYSTVIDVRTETRSLQATKDLVVEPRKFSTRQLQVDDAFVNPPSELTKRIELEAKTLAALWAAPSSTRSWDGPFLRPVPGAPTGRFGARSIFNGQPRAPHTGDDFPNPEGTPVVAPNGGRIVLARELYFAGNTVVIDHGAGVFSLLEHLSTIDVVEGATVRAGERIGLVGATGRVTGPHLHWGVRVNGARVDPLSFLASLGR